jgi:hypothetical protein
VARDQWYLCATGRAVEVQNCTLTVGPTFSTASTPNRHFVRIVTIIFSDRLYIPSLLRLDLSFDASSTLVQVFPRRRQCTAFAIGNMLEVAVREHDKTVAAIEQDLAAVQRRADAEQKRWEKLKERSKRICVTQAGNGRSGRQVYAAISRSFRSSPRFSLMRLRRCAAARASHSARW